MVAIMGSRAPGLVEPEEVGAMMAGSGWAGAATATWPNNDFFESLIDYLVYGLRAAFRPADTEVELDRIRAGCDAALAW